MNMRTFVVNKIIRRNKTKIKFKSHPIHAKTPYSAARKVFSSQCRKIRGIVCLTIKETTPESLQKKYSYEIKREKLKSPIIRFEGTKKEFKINYKIKIKSMTSKLRGGHTTNSNHNYQHTETEGKDKNPFLLTDVINDVYENKKDRRQDYKQNSAYDEKGFSLSNSPAEQK